MFRQNFKKECLKWLMPVIIPAVLFLLLFLILMLNTNRKPRYKTQTAKKIPSGLPQRLVIPAINVDAGIQPIGVTQTGEMGVPSNTKDVAWYKLGPKPGENGSAVISGHYDEKNGEAGVFANLYKLKKGDRLYIEDAKGTQTIFAVREKRTYDPGYADDVFNQKDGVHLNLITCDGLWDKAKNSYSKRLVVFTDTIDNQILNVNINL